MHGSAAMYQWESSLFTQGDVHVSLCVPHIVAQIGSAALACKISLSRTKHQCRSRDIQCHHHDHTNLHMTCHPLVVFLSQRMLSLLYPAGLLCIFAVESRLGSEGGKIMPAVPHDGLCVVALDYCKCRITESLRPEKTSKITKINS